MLRKELLSAGLKFTHTVVLFLSAAAIFFMLWAGLTATLTPFLWLPAALPALVWLGIKANGDECILQTWAKRLEGSDEWVSDIYVPDWLALRVRSIFTPLYALAIIVIFVRLIQHMA